MGKITMQELRKRLRNESKNRPPLPLNEDGTVESWRILREYLAERRKQEQQNKPK